MSSYVGIILQAVPVAMPQVLRQHMRTRLNKEGVGGHASPEKSELSECFWHQVACLHFHKKPLLTPPLKATFFLAPPPPHPPSLPDKKLMVPYFAWAESNKTC